MKHTLAAVLFLFLLYATESRADDICSAASGVAAYNLDTAQWVCRNPDGAQRVNLESANEIRLLALLVLRLDQQTAAINAARQAADAANADLKAAVNNLAAAVNRLNEVSNNVTSAQVAWRKEALKKTLDEVRDIPAKLAANEALQKSLSVSLQKDLISNEAFIDTLRQAVKP